MADTALRRTPLYELHRTLGARMVPFAGYEMPVQYSAGIMAEHLHARAAAALFDVSHMGQMRIEGDGAAPGLESLVPGDITGLAPGRMRYTLLTNDAGGIRDDLMVTRAGDHFILIVNASRKHDDLVHLRAGLEQRRVRVTPLEDRALLALQGPSSAAVLARFAPEAQAMAFLTAAALAVDEVACFVTRSGYTGEDGFEISVPASSAERLARRLLAEPEVMAAGLGARDSLRLEAGLCLYGNDIDEKTTVIEADLAWAIAKRRRAEGGFPGAAVIERQLKAGAARRRVGIKPEGRAPARAGTEIMAGDRTVGRITSGGFGPSVDGPIAMGYVETGYAALGTPLTLIVRGTPRAARVVPLPFVPHRYRRG